MCHNFLFFNSFLWVLCFFFTQLDGIFEFPKGGSRFFLAKVDRQSHVTANSSEFFRNFLWKLQYGSTNVAQNRYSQHCTFHNFLWFREKKKFFLGFFWTFEFFFFRVVPWEESVLKRKCVFHRWLCKIKKKLIFFY